MLILIALFAALTAPYIGQALDRVQAGSEVRKIAAAMRTARSDAIAEKRVLSSNGDLLGNTYWLSGMKEDGLHDKPDNRRRKVGRPVRFGEFNHLNETETEGRFVIRFFPLGNASGGSLTLRAKLGKNEILNYEIHVDPVTGSPRIVQLEG